MVGLLAQTEHILVNIPRMYTAIAQWVACIIFIYFIPKRFSKKKSVLLSLLFFIVILGFNLLSDSWRIEFWILGMIISVVIMFGFIITIAKVNLITAGSITVTSFIASEFVASLEWQMEYFIFTSNSSNFIIKFLFHSPFEVFSLRITLFMILAFFVTFFLLYKLEKKSRSRTVNYKVTNNDFYTVLVMGILVFATSNISFLGISSPITSTNPIETFYIRTLVNLTGIIILFSQREHKQSAQQGLELYTMKNLVDKQYEQYKISKANTVIINQKYHDLKNYIQIIRAEADIEKKMSYIDNLEDSLKKIYMNFESGNRVLDIMLYSKQSSFIENDINFTCVADGTSLEFMDVTDIVSIFGNAIDNAVESLKSIEDPEKRILKLAIYKEGEFVLIKLENYYENQLLFENGDLISTKENKNYHGFGIKSINTVVEKYDGNITINTSKNWFSLLILLPTKSIENI